MFMRVLFDSCVKQSYWSCFAYLRLNSALSGAYSLNIGMLTEKINNDTDR